MKMLIIKFMSMTTNGKKYDGDKDKKNRDLKRKNVTKIITAILMAVVMI